MKKTITLLKKELKEHSLDYLFLATGAVFFMIFLNAFSTERMLMFVIIIAFAFFYILWGIFHHTKSQTLHLKNVLEYILIAFLIIFIIKTILLI